MSRKIIGVTVGTPMSPQTLLEKTKVDEQIKKNAEDIKKLSESMGSEESPITAISLTETTDTMTATFTMEDGSTSTSEVTFDADDNPTKMVVGGKEIPIEASLLGGGSGGSSGGGLPVVELSTTFTLGAQYTTEENAILKNALERNTPIIIKCDITMGDEFSCTDACAVWSKVLLAPDMPAFLIYMNGQTLAIYSYDGGETWSGLIQ